MHLHIWSRKTIERQVKSKNCKMLLNSLGDFSRVNALAQFLFDPLSAGLKCIANPHFEKIVLEHINFRFILAT